MMPSLPKDPSASPAENELNLMGPVTLDDIRTLVSQAMNAPSGDNSQPWRFTWNGQSLAVFYEAPRGQHALNNNHHSTYLTLGCLLEAIEIAASGRNLIVGETLQLEHPEKQPVAILRFHRQPTAPDESLPTLPLRWVDRRSFSGQKLEPQLKLKINSLAAGYPSCGLHFTEDVSDELIQYLVKSDEFMWRNKKVLVDFFKWVRLSPGEVDTNHTGMPWQSLGLRFFEIPAFGLFRKIPFLISVLWPLGMKLKVNKLTQDLIRSSAGLYCISIKKTNPSNIVEAGRLAFRAWLLLNGETCGVQPLSLASMTALDVNMGFAPPDTSRSFLEHFRRGPEILARAFKLPRTETPIWLFRTGPVAPLPVEARSKRLLVEEYFKVYSRDLPPEAK